MKTKTVAREKVVEVLKEQASITLPVDSVSIDENAGELSVSFENEEGILTMYTNGDPLMELQELERKVLDAAAEFKSSRGY